MYILGMKKSPKKNTTKARSKSLSPKFGGLLIIDKLPGYFLILCLVLVFLFLLSILRPFLTVIFLGAVLTISFYPVYRKLLKWFRGWRRLTAFVSCLLIILIIVVPIGLFVLLLTGEAYDTYLLIQDKINSGIFDRFLQWEEGGFFYDLKERISPVIDLDSIDIKQTIVDMANALSSFLIAQTGNFISTISSIIIGLIVMLFSMYYFFKDGDELVRKAGKLSPLPSVYEGELFKKIASMVKAVIFGVFLTAVIQGIVGGIGFAIAGVSSPVFWGTAIAFFSLVPVVGTAVVWVPAAIILALLGNYYAAIFIFIWGFLAVGSVDNFVRPYLIGGKAHTYPLMTFLVVLGGVLTMGLKGVIVGPLVLMVLMSFLHIYEAEYSRVLKK